MCNPVLQELTSPPKANKHDLYRWCDYIELRCLTHVDKRFSRDALADALDEGKDMDADAPLDAEDDEDDLSQPNSEFTDMPETDRHELHSAVCFRHLRWRASSFAGHWPFILDNGSNEIKLKPKLTELQQFYLSLLLSASLSYSPKNRWRRLTGLFEAASIEIMKRLMPKGAEIHAFGAAESTRYTGQLYNKLSRLAEDIRGELRLKPHDFAPHDTGDSGLDIVAWHGLGDERPGIPIAFAQCGCTTTGWPNKMLEASPAHLGGHLTTLHDWATYYFMPLDLSTEHDGRIGWQQFSDFSRSIVIDRLRFIRLTESYSIPTEAITATEYISEAITLNLS